jgi:hypothetical protein
MDELKTTLYGFDFRGPASSEALNQFAEDVSADLNSLLAAFVRLKADVQLLSGQSLKQYLSITNKVKALQSRNAYPLYYADLSDTSVVSYLEEGGGTIPIEQRMELRSQYAVITPPVAMVDYLSYTDGERKYLADGVTVITESIAETGTLYPIPEALAIAGLPTVFYERLLASDEILPDPEEFAMMIAIPPSRTGSGYPLSNFISFIPFPLYSPGIKVYYATATDPTLSVGGVDWKTWPAPITDLYNDGGDEYRDGEPLFASFPQENITALRIDVAQENYLVEGDKYVYSSGLGLLSFGLMRPTTSTAKVVVRIDHETSNFVSVGDAHVTFSNVDTSELDDLYETSSWIDPNDASVAYVEITLHPEILSGKQIPIITQVAVEYED